MCDCKWMDIETAPRGSGMDGPAMVTHPDYVEPPKLLLATPEGLAVGYYDWFYHPCYGRGADEGQPPWRYAMDNGPIFDPTHWQPLPPPPVEQAKWAHHAPTLLSDADAAANLAGVAPVAWINEEQTIGPHYGKKSLSFEPFYSSNPLHYKHTPLYTRPAPAQQPLTEEQIQDLLGIGNPTEEECRLIRLGWNAAHGIGGEK